MFKGACRLDDSVHRTIILRQHFQVKQFRLRSEDYPYTYFCRSGCLGGLSANATEESTPDRTRTCNPQIRSLVLYPIELRARMVNGSDEIIDKRAGVSIRPLVFLCMHSENVPCKCAEITSNDIGLHFMCEAL